MEEIFKKLDFKLPDELIAIHPANPRDSARLLIYDRSTKSITDDYFYNLGKYLAKDTSLVLNNAKVDKCRLRFGKIEIFLTETFNDKTAKAMVRPGKKFKQDSQVELPSGITAKVLAIDGEGLRTIEFNHSLDSDLYNDFRLTPLPPYIPQDESLSEEYQTVYAKTEGSKAAPTAGLHFTDSLINQLSVSHEFIEVTLNVGLGTFAPLTEKNIEQKSLHEETYTLSKNAASKLSDSSHITAVGTTSTRLLESNIRKYGKFHEALNESTDIFIQSSDEINSIDSLITNFHLPSTSLLLMVSALTGVDELKRIYEHAIRNKYRFYSFGDAMLVL